MVKNPKSVKSESKTYSFPSSPSRGEAPLKEDERIAWLRLIRTPSIGPLSFYRLLHQYGSATQALNVLPDLFKKQSLKEPLSLFSLKEAEEEFENHRRQGAHLLAACDPDYPELLRTLPDAPPIISVKGRLELLSLPALAIVGARNASYHGKYLAEQLARALSEQNWLIVSGLARGIDAQAHRGSLPRGTIAVVAGGVDNIYPPENEALYHSIAAQGVIISDAPWGTQPQATLFPKRNRLISGLSRGVIVIEAAERSGSLITARYALEQGREVFAVPGSPLDPRCRGGNRLLQEGAALVQTTDDVLNALSSFTSLPSPTPSSPPPLDKRDLFFEESTLESCHERILENLSSTPVNLDDLIRVCQLSPPLVLQTLTELELSGRIHRLSTSLVVRADLTKEK